MTSKYSFVGWTARVLGTRAERMGAELLGIIAQKAKAVNSTGSSVNTVLLLKSKYVM